MAEALIFRVIREQREAVNASEKSVLQKLTRLWLEPFLYLNEQAEGLTKVIREEIEKGKPVSQEYLYSLSRYREMRAQALSAIRRYNAAAEGVIEGAEADVVIIGGKNMRKLVNIAEPDDPLWTRVNQRETRIVSGMLSERSPLRQLLDRSYAEYQNKIDGVLMTGLATGQGSGWIADKLSEAGQIPLRRALTIARTEVNRAYREANLETMRESRAVTGYRRMCYPPTACFACLMMDGEFYEKYSSFSDHPNGKCSAVPVTKHFDPINEKGWERGQEWFAKQDEETQRKLMGAGRFDLWKQETVDLRDMVYIKENDIWGGSPTVKSLAELKTEAETRPFVSNEHRDMANGMRQSAYHILTEDQIDSLRKDIQEIKADEFVFRFNSGRRTGYIDEDDIINVCGDVLPDPNSTRARDKMSSRAVLAHEYFGHRANRGTILPTGAWNDEFRASYMAAKNAPGLSVEDRYFLIQDAIDRALEANINIRYNQFMKEILYGRFS